MAFGLFSERGKRAPAELAGIRAGDGGVYHTNSGVAIEIRGNPDEPKYYSRYVRPLFEITTGICPINTLRSYSGGHMAGLSCCRREGKMGPRNPTHIKRLEGFNALRAGVA
ncbi:MAG: hypothetical protein OK454_01155 [Thaumarchaeota archaeon]|nr:hypothetical protein [Nitrososphaerota archaeon]